MGDLVKELFRIRRYKSNLGKLVRKLTMIGIWIIFASGAFKLSQMVFESVPLMNDQGVRYLVAALITAFGMWFGYRLVNWPTFADFLISVEAEMLKVSWPGKAELYSSTIVVLVMFCILTVMIFAFDMAWLQIFRFMKIM